jgi:hypothetical protein
MADDKEDSVSGETSQLTNAQDGGVNGETSQLTNAQDGSVNGETSQLTNAQDTGVSGEKGKTAKSVATSKEATKYENVNWQRESGASSRRSRSSYGGKFHLS